MRAARRFSLPVLRFCWAGRLVLGQAVGLACGVGAEMERFVGLFSLSFFGGLQRGQADFARQVRPPVRDKKGGADTRPSLRPWGTPASRPRAWAERSDGP